MPSATWRCGVGLSANVNVLPGVVCQRVCAEAVVVMGVMLHGKLIGWTSVICVSECGRLCKLPGALAGETTHMQSVLSGKY